MRVGINLMAVLPGINGGVENYVRNLLCAMTKDPTSNRYYLFTNRTNHDSFEIQDPRFIRVPMRVSGSSPAVRVVWEQIALPIVAKKLRLNVLHSPSYTWPVLSGIPGVVTVHDMLYVVHPKYIGEPKLTFWRLFVPLSVRRCRTVITVSENSRHDILRYLNLPPEKVVVTPEALDRRFEAVSRGWTPTGQMATACTLENPYVLNVGGCAAHKNAAALIRALKEVRSLSGTDRLELVIVGRDHGVREQLERLSDSLGIRGAVVFTGYVKDEELRRLYEGASVYVSPSHLEGFGLTVLEAMASGIPVMVSNRGSLPEVVRDAALVVDPDRQEDMVDGLHRLVLDSQLRDELVRKARSLAATYSWQKAMRLTLEVYRRAADCSCSASDRLAPV